MVLVRVLPLEIALQHQRNRDTVSDAASRRVLRLWRQIDPQELDQGWAMYGAAITEIVAAAQVDAAQQTRPYMTAIAASASNKPAVQIVPEMFGGVAADGRELEPLLYSAVTSTKTWTGRGLGASTAFEAGASFLATLAGSVIRDLGRQADSTFAAGKRWTQYVRVLNPGACSRCAVLAGKSSNAVAFKRHPRCRCTAFPLPSTGSVPSGFFESGDDYFESLSRAEQDRIFTRSGAEAIRQGGDVNMVVNARRGAYGISYSGHGLGGGLGEVRRLQRVTIGVRADGTPLQVYATFESTTRRGDFGRSNFTGSGRRTQTVRLMPEQIQIMAGGDPGRYRELLIRYGYLG